MRYAYVAIDPDGREIKGFLEAASVREAINALNDEGRIPISAKPVGAEVRTSDNAENGKKLTPKNLPGFTRRLAQMTSAGVPVETALRSLAKSADSDAATLLALELTDGKSLAEAMEAYGDPFSPVYVALVRAGEASGELGALLTRLADDLERARETRGGLISALVYPALLLIVSLLVFSLLMLFVVPRFETLFADAQSELPLATQIVIGAARLMQSLWWAPLALFLTGFAYLRLNRENDTVQLRLSDWRLGLPIVGGLTREFETARLTRTLGALLSSGVPAYDAVRLAAGTVQNLAERVRAEAALHHMRKGEKLSEAFAHENIGTGDFIEIIEVGEASGKLGPALLQAASIFENNLTRRLKTIVAMVEPIIIMTLGVLIGGVVLSLFVAILSVNDLAF